jgi:hypothetical protein
MFAALIYPFAVFATPNGVSTTIQPATVLIEGGVAQYVNCDLLFHNNTAKRLTLDRIQVSVFDSAGALELKRFIDTNGFSPSIQTIAHRTIAPNGEILVFNPFFEFDQAMDLTRLEFEATFSEKNSDKEYVSSATVYPRAYHTKTNLILPLHGRLIVHDGHDFYAHHRRLDYALPIAAHYAIRSNFMRYAYDFCLIDANGKLTSESGKSNEHWLSFGATVFAPGSGKVSAAFGDQPDNLLNAKNYFDPELLPRNPMSFYGNYIVIDHGNGEFSVLGHLRKGSIRVKVGDVVAQGQEVAAVGASGSANNPHLHYELRTGNGLNVEGLPSAFRGFRRILGSQSIELSGEGYLNSGDIVQTTAK